MRCSLRRIIYQRQQEFFLFCLFAFLTSVRCAQAQRPSLDDIAKREASSAISESIDTNETAASNKIDPSERKESVRPFRGYVKYKALLSMICQRLDLDERRVDLLTILNRLAATKRECMECNAFFQTFLTGCRSARSGRLRPAKMASTKSKKTERKTVTITPESTPAPERDPHAAVIDAVSSAFIAIGEDSAINEISISALDELSVALQKADGLTPAGRDYFRTVDAFIQAPFEVLRRRLGPAENSGALGRQEQFSPEEKQQKLQDLF